MDLAALGADGEELTAGTTKAGPDATPGQPVLARLDAMQNQARGASCVCGGLGLVQILPDSLHDGL